jgi:hypothetical protein
MIFPSALLLGLALQVPVQAPPVVTIPRVEAAVVVDGRLDEAVWSQAARLTGFHQQEPADGRPAEEKTEVLVWYAPDAIHFGIRALDSQPGLIRATQADRDNIDSEDHVIIYLDTFADRRRAFFFSVNPLGVQGDGVRTEGAASAGRTFGGNIDNSPDFQFESRGHVTEEGYVVEVRIPFKSLRYPAADAQRWGLQVMRKIQRTGYTDTWTDVRRASASFLLQAGTIDGLHDLKRGVVLEAQPFITVNAPGSVDVATGEFSRDDPAAETGINLRAGFTSMSVDATINPDFSQVESDAGQVTVNERFALFFPEKRPFFLEGIELFNTPGQLVYTRRIGNPIAGAKLTGKLGSISIAHLTAVDQNVNGGNREALFNITRLRQDFGASSSAGVTYTDRSLLDGPGSNRVVSGDVRLVFAKLYYFETQLANAWTSLDTADRSGVLWKVEVDRTGRGFGFNYSINGIDDDFHTDAGFVRRTGVVDAHLFNRFSWYGAPGAFVETTSIYVNPSRVWNYSGFGDASAIEGNDALSFNFGLRGGWRVETRGDRTFFHPDAADYAGLQVGTVFNPRPYTPLEEISGNGLRLQVSTPTFQRFNATLVLAGGSGAIFEEGAEGQGFQASGSLSVRPSAQIRLTATTAYAQLDRSRDDSEFARSLIPRIKAEYQATRHLFLRGILEHRSERRAALVAARTGEPLLLNGVPVAAERDNGLRVDALISYEPTPGTVAYFGYGSSYAETSLFERQLRRVDDGFFVKLAYQFRR